MTHEQALDALADDPHVWRYREMTADDNPNQRQRDAWRARVISMVTGEPVPEPAPVAAYPSLVQQAMNAGGAAARFVGAAVRGEQLVVSPEERARRLAICKAPCEFWDAKQEKCVKCGCYGNFKTRLASESCPIGKWG